MHKRWEQAHYNRVTTSEIHIKAIRKHHCTPTRRARRKGRLTTNVAENTETPELRYIADDTRKLYNRFGSQFGSFL